MRCLNVSEHGANKNVNKAMYRSLSENDVQKEQKVRQEEKVLNETGFHDVTNDSDAHPDRSPYDQTHLKAETATETDTDTEQPHAALQSHDQCQTQPTANPMEQNVFRLDDNELRSFATLFNDTEEEVNETSASSPSWQRFGPRRHRGLTFRYVSSSILTLLDVVFHVSMRVSLPIYVRSMERIGSDSYTVLSISSVFLSVIFAALAQIVYLVSGRQIEGISTKPKTPINVILKVGVLMTLGGVLMTYSSLPERNPPYLQAILAAVSVPFTAVCRFLLLKKGINFPRILVASAITFGILIGALPYIFKLPGSGGNDTIGNQPTGSRILWTSCYVIGFLPSCLINIFGEKVLKKDEWATFSFVTWTHLVQLIFTVMMFWTDFLPVLGMTNSFDEFYDHLKTGWYCNFHSVPECSFIIQSAWLFYLSYCLANICQMVLIQTTEGAIYAAIVQALVSPIVVVFWTLFKIDGDLNSITWDPVFNETTAFVVAGMAIVIPGVIIYNYICVMTGSDREWSTDQQQQCRDRVP